MNRLKQFRRIMTHDGKRIANYQAILCLAAIVL
jgi:hypothetical protein